MRFRPQPFVESLSKIEIPDNSAGTLLNPYFEPVDVDIDNDMPARRRLYLENHIARCEPTLILVTDTLTYYGSRQTGVPLTSEWLVINNRIPRVPLTPKNLPPGGRLTNTDQPFNEPGASAIWQSLTLNNLADRTICWPVLPLQPYRADTGHNRMPTKEEMELGLRWLDMLIQFSGQAEVITIGSRVRDLFSKHKMPYRCALKQPSRGGITEYNQVFSEIAVERDLITEATA